MVGISFTIRKQMENVVISARSLDKWAYWRYGMSLNKMIKKTEAYFESFPQIGVSQYGF